MVTIQEIKNLINKHLIDKVTAQDELAAINAAIGLEQSAKLDQLIILSGGQPISPIVVETREPECGVLKPGCIIGFEAIALGTANANQQINIAIGGRAYSAKTKDNINRFERVVIVGGTPDEPFVSPIRRTNIVDTNTTYEPRSTYIERVASTVADPVPAGAGITANIPEHLLIDLERGRDDWGENQYLVIFALGSDSHDNSFYRWVIDDQDYESISRPAAIGSLNNPFYFPGGGEKAYKNVQLWVSNGSSVDLPNTGGGTSDDIAYEGIVIGRFVNQI